MKAVILAGGIGSRLKPFTDIIPKPLLPIGEKSILDIQIERLRIHGVTDVYLATNYKSDYISNFVGDGQRHGVRILISKEDKPLGTCGPLKLLEEHLDEPFLVMNGDILTNANFKEIAEFGLAQDTIFSVVTKQMVFPFQFGNVISKENRVVEVIEKPDFEVEILSGIYFFKPEALEYIPSDVYFGIDDFIGKLLAANREIGRYLLHDYWLDIGRVDSFEEANKAYKEHFCQPAETVL